MDLCFHLASHYNISSSGSKFQSQGESTILISCFTLSVPSDHLMYTGLRVLIREFISVNSGCWDTRCIQIESKAGSGSTGKSEQWE